MALRKCRECGNEICTTASSCPHCGKKGSLFFIGAIRDILVVGILVWVVFNHFKTGGDVSVTGGSSVSQEVDGAMKKYSNCEETIRVPPQQTEFCEAINSYRKLYFNEYHKKEYPEQKKNLEAIFNERTSRCGKFSATERFRAGKE